MNFLLLSLLFAVAGAQDVAGAAEEPAKPATPEKVRYTAEGEPMTGRRQKSRNPGQTMEVQNNLWGLVNPEADGTQTTVATKYTGDFGVAWETTFDWARVLQGHAVMSYANAKYLPIEKEPLQLSSITSIPTEWDFAVEMSEAGTLNVAYDLFTTTNVEDLPIAKNFNYELMVWLDVRNPGSPVLHEGEYGTYNWGNPEFEVEVEGEPWWVWTGLNGKMETITFGRKEATTEARLDIMSFWKVAIAKAWIPDTEWLRQVQAGSEVFHGKGSVKTTRFEIEVLSGDNSKAVNLTETNAPEVTATEVPEVTATEVPEVTATEVPEATATEVPEVPEVDSPEVDAPEVSSKPSPETETSTASTSGLTDLDTSGQSTAPTEVDSSTGAEVTKQSPLTETSGVLVGKVPLMLYSVLVAGVWLVV